MVLLLVTSVVVVVLAGVVAGLGVLLFFSLFLTVLELLMDMFPKDSASSSSGESFCASGEALNPTEEGQARDVVDVVVVVELVLGVGRGFGMNEGIVLAGVGFGAVVIGVGILYFALCSAIAASSSATFSSCLLMLKAALRSSSSLPLS